MSGVDETLGIDFLCSECGNNTYSKVEYAYREKTVHFNENGTIAHTNAHRLSWIHDVDDDYYWDCSVCGRSLSADSELSKYLDGLTRERD